jgi:hypothetical protein
LEETMARKPKNVTAEAEKTVIEEIIAETEPAINGDIPTEPFVEEVPAAVEAAEVFIAEELPAQETAPEKPAPAKRGRKPKTDAEKAAKAPKAPKAPKAAKAPKAPKAAKTVKADAEKTAEPKVEKAVKAAKTTKTAKKPAAAKTAKTAKKPAAPKTAKAPKAAKTAAAKTAKSAKSTAAKPAKSTAAKPAKSTAAKTVKSTAAKPAKSAAKTAAADVKVPAKRGRKPKNAPVAEQAVQIAVTETPVKKTRAPWGSKTGKAKTAAKSAEAKKPGRPKRGKQTDFETAVKVTKTRTKKQMSYDSVVGTAQAALLGRKVSSKIAKIPVNIILHGSAEGTLYILIENGSVDVQPYRYVDSAVNIKLSADNFLALLEKKFSIPEGIANLTFEIEGDSKKVLAACFALFA